ncbi:hypothetical protein [Novosphingobium kaempferiae]|uniref:hypothetical protein n=1 Tax=Novosphingobium kaempferiae TaxID=2896849 RepID=UPI001E2D665D|nr:hypothetical protein [Novosphingobium kaempferiae]
MTEPAVSGQPFPRAFLRVAGASVAQHQLGMALALECQRVICMARGTSPELIALQHDAEDAGLQFAIATGAGQLAGLVTAGDELVVISEGLFADPVQVAALLEGRAPVVLVQPVEGALAAGFERIDINRATAGVMRVPGSLVERLHELPIDVDAVSALTRIALQSGITMREVPSAARAGSGWRMVRSEAEAYALEDEWMRARFAQDGTRTPGRTIARFAVLSFGSSLLHAGNASNVVSAAVLVALFIAAGTGWFGFLWCAFAFLAIAWLLVEASRLLRAAERHALGQASPAIPRADALVWLVDVAFAALILLDTPRFPGEPVLAWLCTPAILMLLLVLLPRIAAGRFAGLFADRALLGLVLAFASGFGQVLLAVRLISAGLVVAALVLPRRRDG